MIKLPFIFKIKLDFLDQGGQLRTWELGRVVCREFSIFVAEQIHLNDKKDDSLHPHLSINYKKFTSWHKFKKNISPYQNLFISVWVWSSFGSANIIKEEKQRINLIKLVNEIKLIPFKCPRRCINHSLYSYGVQIHENNVCFIRCTLLIKMSNQFKQVNLYFMFAT